MSGEKGAVPEGWTYTNLRSVCSKITDGTHDTPATIEKGIPYITAIHVKESNIDFDGCYFLSKQDHKKVFQRCNPERGDVLVVNIGAGVAAAAIVGVDFEFSMKNVALLKPDRSKTDGKFLEQHQIYKKSDVVRQIAAGGAQPFLSLDMLSKLPILLPPLPEQRKIAAILSTWDDSIATLTNLLAAKRQQKRGLAEALLTGKKRLKGFAGEREETELSHVIRESRVPAEDELGKRLTVSLHLRGVSVRDERDNSEVGKTIYYRRKAGQFIYGKQNIFRGSMGIVPDKLDGYLSSQDLPAFDVASGFSVHYLYEYFARPSFYEGLEKIATGTGSKRVHPEALYKLRIPFPPLPEQQAIASILSTLDGEIASLEALKAKVQEQKRGLMDELLTGRVRVKVEETC